MTVNIKPIVRSAIRIDGGTQARVTLNADTVAEYKAALADGKVLPPIIVFFDGTDFWLGDGFHRYHAQEDKASVMADVRVGTKRDAILFACGANANHGLQRSNEDKRRAVAIMLGDAEWAKMSDREIAKHCAVSNTFVSNIRTPKAPKPPAPPAPPKAPTPPAEPKPPAPAPAPVADGAAPPPADPGVNVDTGAGADGDDDLADELQRLMAENAELRAQVAAASVDDKAAKIVGLMQQLEITKRRNGELMQSVKDREDDLKKTNRTIRRICTAVGEEDPTKVAATVELFVRNAKVGA